MSRRSELFTNLRTALNAGNTQRALALLYDLEQEVNNEILEKEKRIENLQIQLSKAEHDTEPYEVEI